MEESYHIRKIHIILYFIGIFSFLRALFFFVSSFSRSGTIRRVVDHHNRTRSHSLARTTHRNTDAREGRRACYVFLVSSLRVILSHLEKNSVVERAEQKKDKKKQKTIVVFTEEI